MPAALAYALLAAVAVLIVLLHLLKPRPLQRMVSSTLLWVRTARRHSRRDARWRWLLSLALSLGIGFAIAAALSRPQLGSALGGARLVLVLDNSPSMAARTREGSTRWSHAVEQARALADAAGAQVMLLDTMGRAPLSGFVSPAQAQAALNRLSVHCCGPARLPVLPSGPGIEVHVFTDGVASIETTGAVVHPVFEPADNVAVTGLDARPFPADLLRYEAFVQLFNASPGPKRVRLALRGGERFALSQELNMAAGELLDASFDVTGFEGGILAAAAMAPGDAFALDDIAFAVVNPHRPRSVVLVSAGNPQLEDSLRSLPGVRLRVIEPRDHRGSMEADAYVFDRFAPPEPPLAGALLFRPPATRWLPAVPRDVGNPAVTGWDHAHTLSDGLTWRDLRVKRAALLTERPPEIHSIVRASQGALIATGKAAAPWIAVGFASWESNLPLQPGFPVFLGNAIAWLTEPTPSLIRALGPVQVPLPDAEVVNGNGVHVPSHAIPGGTAFNAAQPDVYTVRGGGRQIQVVANVLDPRLTDVNRSRFEEGDLAGLHVSATHRWPVEPWTALLWAGALLLLVEWAAYAGRVTR